MWVRRLNQDPLKRQPVLLTTRPLLWPQTQLFWKAAAYYQTEQRDKSHTTQNRPKLKNNHIHQVLFSKMDKQSAARLFDEHYPSSNTQRLTVLDAGYTRKPVKSGLVGLCCALFRMLVVYCFLKSENKAGKAPSESFLG